MRTAINILPASYRRQQIVRSRVVQWTTIIAVVLVAGWGWHWIEMREQTYLSQRLEVLSREHAPTQTMLKQLMDMRRQLKELQQQEAVAKELETQRNALTLLGVISDTAQKTKGRLRVTRLELNNFQNAGKAEGTSSSAPPPGGLVLSGMSLDNGSVSELVVLEKLKEREGMSLRDYEVRCEF
jgi:hypothetical protein